MQITETCAECLYNKQKEGTANHAYLAEVRSILDNRTETDSSPYIVMLINRIRERYFGAGPDYGDLKKQYNDMVLGMEDALRNEINRADDPLAAALVMARIGNYIDFGALDHVDRKEFMGLFRNTEMREDDKKTYDAFLRNCAAGKSFLLLCDNCGEIVLDKLLLEQIREKFPHLSMKAMVRGGNVLNDATAEDAVYAGLDSVAEIISNGEPIPGTVYDRLPADARDAVDTADVILSKGQSNYEAMSGQGFHVFYMFLCKCDLFTDRFKVPRLTGMFIEEKAGKLC